MECGVPFHFWLLQTVTDLPFTGEMGLADPDCLTVWDTRLDIWGHAAGGLHRPQSIESITHEMAVQRLRAAGADQVADRLAAIRNVDGGLGGWDGYVRGTFNKRIVGIVWPEEAHGRRSRRALARWGPLSCPAPASR
jgi:hypothetical protein